VQQIGESSILSLTPSKVRDYQTCPQQYRLKTITRHLVCETSPALSFGNSIHSALEEIHTHFLPTGQKADCKQLLRKHWRPGDYADERESNLYFTRGLEALRRYTEAVERAKGQTIGTEVYLSRVVRLNSVRVRLGCKVDRIELRPDDSLEALDYKTNAGGQVPTPESLADDLATFIYYVLVRISYPEPARVIVSQLNVLTLAKVEVLYDETRLAAHKQSLIKLVKAIESGAFEPRPGSPCSWCRVRDHCPASGADADLDNII